MSAQLILVLTLLTFAAANPFKFKDVTRAVGIDLSKGRLLKYGGPAVADLDGDGHQDLILCHHGSSPLEVYFNTGKGSFKKSKFSLRGDLHGTVPYRHSTGDRGMRFSVSKGGGAGTKATNPLMYQVNPRTREIREVTSQAGITVFKGRGRSAVYMDLTLGGKKYGPDVVYTNGDVSARKCPVCKDPQFFGYRNVGGGKFAAKTLQGLGGIDSKLATVADVNNDGQMELVIYKNFEIFKVTGTPLKLTKISSRVLPKSLQPIGNVLAVAELDYDNDGDFDLYLAREKTGLKDKAKGTRRDDILLENRNGVYVDVSRRAGIPRGTFSSGVTAADFDNDGYMDIYVSAYDQADMMLRNNGDGTFTTIRGLVNRPSNTRGDMAQAVDYNADGQVDLIVSQGDYSRPAQGGFFRVLRNKLPKAKSKSRFLLVRVGNAPGGGATSLHAVVTVTAGKLTMKRRVGSPGTSVSSSYIELVHFGLGRATRANVSVRWTNGARAGARNVAHGRTIVLGKV